MSSCFKVHFALITAESENNILKIQLMGIDYKFDLLLSEDGSGRGAALVAATLKSK